MVLRLISCSPRGTGLVSPRRLRSSHRLDTSVGVPGPHDFAVRAGNARLACRPGHRIPRPTCRDDRDTPLWGCGTASSIQLICASDKAKYFSKLGLTRFRKISPSGKSVRGSYHLASAEQPGWRCSLRSAPDIKGTDCHFFPFFPFKFIVFVRIFACCIAKRQSSIRRRRIPLQPDQDSPTS
jgi:hypothetical protein